MAPVTTAAVRRLTAIPASSRTGPVADGAVCDDRFRIVDTSRLKYGTQRIRVFERSVFAAQRIDGDMHGARNVSRAPRVLCRARRPEPLTDVLLTRTHIEHEISRFADGGFDVLPRGENVGARGRKNVRGFG